MPSVLRDTKKDSRNICTVGLAPDPFMACRFPIAADSKEEMFFDAQAWQETSSEEDDFYSVNGDFVPSGASSPIHGRSFTGFPPVTRTLSVSRSSFFKHESPSFTEKKEPLDHGDALPNPKYKKEIQLVQFFQDRYLEQSGGTTRS